MFDENYQSEVFPYNENKTQITNVDQTNNLCAKNIPNVPVGSHSSDSCIVGSLINQSKHHWLQNVHPQRFVELLTVETIVKHLKNINQQLDFPQVGGISTKLVDESEQNPYDELERQALEQYQASEICLVPQNDVDTAFENIKLQDLQREALEQYEECEEYLAPSLCSDHSHKHLPFTTTNNALPNKIDCLSLPCIEIDDDFPKISEDKTQFQKASRTLGSKHAELTIRSKINWRKFNNKQAKSLIDLESSDKKPLKQGREPKREEQSKSKTISEEDEIRNLASSLKHKVLNYLKRADLKIVDTSKLNLKHHSSKEVLEKPIQERIKLSNIKDMETYKAYVREVSTKTRGTLLNHFKRMRMDLMESTSRGAVRLIAPTGSEKRKIRQIIKKCVELLKHADMMNKIWKTYLNSLKREVTDLLDLIHSTMKVIYTLRDLSKEAFEGAVYLRNRGNLVLELYLEKCTLHDKPEFVGNKMTDGQRSTLLLITSTRYPGIIFDRIYQSVNAPRKFFLYLDHEELRNKYDFINRRIDEFPTPGCPKFRKPTSKSLHLSNTFQFWKMENFNIWDDKHWTHNLESSDMKHHVNMIFCSSARQAECFHRVINFNFPHFKYIQSAKQYPLVLAVDKKSQPNEPTKSFPKKYKKCWRKSNSKV